ncbi:hypothetical protein [Parapedobacter sp.]
MINKWIIKKLKELSPEELYTPSEDALAVSDVAPTDVEKQQLLETLQADADFRAMTAEHQRGFQAFIFRLERELSVINTEGRPVKVNIRLTVCAEMARVLYFRRKGVPGPLRFVVIEAKHTSSRGIWMLPGWPRRAGRKNICRLEKVSKNTRTDFQA